MACGDPKAAFRVAILDPLLTRSQPRAVTAATGYDAISHAVESYVTTKRTPASRGCSRGKRGGCSSANFERVLHDPGDLEARGAMQLGAHCAGIAIENSMLGATHACANPLTAHYGTTHGVAIAVAAAARGALEPGIGTRAVSGSWAEAICRIACGARQMPLASRTAYAT